MGWVAAIPAIASVAGGLIGQHQSDVAAGRAQGNIQSAIDAYTQANVPIIESQKISPEMLQYIQDYMPQMEQTQTMGPTAMDQIAVDPRLKGQQMDALAQLSGLSKTGLSTADLAALEQTRRGAAAEAQAKQGQILQEMSQRGQGGSGAELIARLKADQAGADRQSAEGLQIAQQAQQRALQALTQGATLAGSVRGQEYNEQSDLARARDIINQFNTQNAQSVSHSNIGNQNQAQQANIAARQNMANTNVGMRNTAEQYNKQLLQQQYQNQLAKASGIAGQYGNAASLNQADAANKGNMWANLISGAGKGIAGGMGDKKAAADGG